MPSVYLMSPPARDWVAKAKANVFSQSAAEQSASPPGAALQDWTSVAEAIEVAGGRVLVMPAPSHLGMTGLPYTAEAGHFFIREGGARSFILPNMKPAHRQAEPTYIAGFVSALGFRIHAVSGLWEGQGDVIRIDDDRLVHTYGEGPAARTEKTAYSQVAPLLSRKHLHLPFKADPWFHGNTFLGVFRPARQGPPTIVVCPEALSTASLEQLKAFAPDAHVFPIRREESLGYATNALQVQDTVIAPSGQPERILGLWRELGLKVVELPLPALFRSGGGAAVCLTNRLDGFPVLSIPAHLTLTAFKNTLATQG